ncbi:MAG: hypothetical protein K5985_02100 [Lachnospiraceae bacterium]|nr:hypothetical protein [Lachnospiraceae bacterium]
MLKKAAATLLILGLSLSLTACTEIPNTRIGSNQTDDKKTTDTKIPEAIPSGETTEAETESEYVPLPEFCGSEDLTAWFDHIQNETPAKMTYVVFTEGGGTPVEYTDPDIISSIAEGLRTLPIRPEAKSSQTDSDFQYRFKREDGSTISFTFCSGTNFYWKGAEYEVDWKDFPKLPLYREIHADAAGFSTKCYDSCTVEEEGDAILIYPDESDSFIYICHYEDPGMDAEDFVKEYIPITAREAYEGRIADEDEFFRFPFEDGDDALPSVLLTYDDDEDRFLRLYSCKQAGDDLIIFEAIYPEGQEQPARSVLETAIRELEIFEPGIPEQNYDVGTGVDDPDILY